MDRIILLHYGGTVSEQFELVGIRPYMLTFGKPPSFNELVTRVRGVMNVECELRLHGRYDMGGGQQTDVYDATLRVRRCVAVVQVLC
jgi:hypothetical protein